MHKNQHLVVEKSDSTTELKHFAERGKNYSKKNEFFEKKLLYLSKVHVIIRVLMGLKGRQREKNR